MLNKSKKITMICGIMVGILFILAVMAILLISGILSLGKTDLLFVTESAEALYDGTPLTNHRWTLNGGSLKDGHELKINYRGKQTNVGESENIIQVTIVDELGADVTGDYNIDYKFGTLKVNPRTLVITSESESKDYDGKPLTNTNYEISEGGDALVKGHKAVVRITGFIIDPGSVNNTVNSVNVYDENGKDVTRNYRLIIREGLLTVFGIGIDDGGGEETGPGIDPDGPIEGGDMEVVFPPSLIPAPGDENIVLFSVYSDIDDSIYLKTQSFGDYNGQGWEEIKSYAELINDGQNSFSASYLTSYALAYQGAYEHTVSIKSFCGLYALPYYMSPVCSGDYEVQSSDVLYSGDTQNVYSLGYYKYDDLQKGHPSLVEYENLYREFVYANYLSIDKESEEYMMGIIEREGFSADDPEIIEKVAKYIKNAAVYNLFYDSGLDSEKNIAVAFLEKYKEGVCRHYASAATLLFRTLKIPARSTVGALAKAKADTWTDVKAAQAHAWVEVYIDGIGWKAIEVTGSGDGGPFDLDGEMPDGEGGDIDGDMLPFVKLTPITVRKQYDGKPIKAVAVLRGFEEYEKLGYTYSAVVSGERTEAGKTNSIIEELTLYDPSGKEVTENFNIIKKTGVVHVYYDIIKCYSNSFDIEYCGYLEGIDFSCERDALPKEYEVLFESTASPNVGMNLNSFNVKILDESENDVADLYWVQKIYGKINISSKPIAFKAGDAEKQYDGAALTCDVLDIIEGELAKGHSIGLFTISGSQTEIGRSDNMITHIMIVDEKGNNVTSNYSIKLEAGKLKVTAK